MFVPKFQTQKPLKQDYAIRAVRKDGRIPIDNLEKYVDEKGALRNVIERWLERYPNATFAVVYIGEEKTSVFYQRKVKKKVLPVTLNDWSNGSEPAMKEVQVCIKRKLKFTKPEYVRGIINRELLSKAAIIEKFLGKKPISAHRQDGLRYDEAVDKFWATAAEKAGLAS